MLNNIPMFLGNLAVALLVGLVFCVSWELPFAKLQKLAMGKLVTTLSQKSAPKWSICILIFFVAFILLFVANFLNHLHLSKLSSAWW